MASGIGAFAVAAMAGGHYGRMPSKQDRLLTQGIRYFRGGEPQLALRSLDQALVLEPAAAHLRFARGIILLRQNKYPAAAVDFEEVKRDAVHRMVLECLAYAYLKQSRFNAASVNYAAAAELANGKRRAALLVALAYSLRRERQYDQAFAAATKAMNAAPDYQPAYFLRAQLIISPQTPSVTDAETALQDIERAVGLPGGSWATELGAAHVYSEVAASLDGDFAEEILKHLRNAAVAGAPRRVLRAPWVLPWADPALLPAAEIEPSPPAGLEAPYVEPPDLETTLDLLAIQGRGYLQTL